MCASAVARNQRGALTQAGAGIAASRLAIWSISRGHSCLCPIAGDRLAARVRAKTLQRLIMTRTVLTRLTTFVALTLVIGIAGCAARRPSIAELKFNPGRYQDRNV